MTIFPGATAEGPCLLWPAHVGHLTADRGYAAKILADASQRICRFRYHRERTRLARAYGCGLVTSKSLYRWRSGLLAVPVTLKRDGFHLADDDLLLRDSRERRGGSI